MEQSQPEEATQPATQIIVDPRRLGQQGDSGLSTDDLANICCILHPITLPACKAAADVYHTTPQHAISAESAVQIREHGDISDVQDFELDAEGIVSCDIALRLSSSLKDAPSGFVFGRNKGRCDIVMGNHQVCKRISNVHFRIYINEYGVIMLEDQSTNGTAVDGLLLRGKDKENGHEYRHTLEHGSIITLTMTEPEIDYRFTVRIPPRDDDAEDAYQRNLTAHFLRMNTVKAGRAKARHPQGRNEPVNLFPDPEMVTQESPSHMVAVRSIREWKGGAKYNKIGCIGKGAFAVVYKLTAKFDGIPYAAKELEKRRFMKNGILDQKVDTEMNIMRNIQHPNVVRFIEHVDWEDKLYIIMEFVPGGDLGSLIGRVNFLPENNVQDMARQLLSALKYLHDKGITHRDVKPDNILISSTTPFQVKLTDFGLSKMIDSEETFLRTFCGTLLYCAPEVYQEYREYDEYGQRHRRDKRSLPPQRYGHAVDIWSLAGVLFFALCGSPPYRARNGVSYQELLNQIMTTPLDIRPLQVINISERGIRFVRKMLHVRPEYRAIIAELEQASWLTGEADTFAASTQESEGASIVDDFIDPDLAASQLSIHDPGEQERQVGDSEILGTQNDFSYDRGIPSSFSTEGLSHEDDSLEYVPATAPNGQGQRGRLFGEVNLSDLGNPATIAGELPLAQPQPLNSEEGEDQDPRDDHGEDIVLDHKEDWEHVMNPAARVALPDMMPPPQPRIMAIRGQALPTAKSTSLHFAESMVDKLNMNSPVPESSFQPNFPATTIEVADATNTSSLRRSRIVYEEGQKPAEWVPVDMPQKRRRQSAREIHMELPASVFWDPRDRTTHHFNYPRMSNIEFDAFQEYAATKGEKFIPGQKTFETTMQSFRTTLSRSPSMETEAAGRAHSEPTKVEGRRMMMLRDERRLSKDDSPLVGEVSSSDNSMEVTADSGISAGPPRISIEPHVGNDFQEPKKILGRFMPDPESCLPTVAFNITDPVTTWGRSSENTLRSINDKRIPDHGFKLVLFKPGFYDGDQSQHQTKWSDNEQDMTFYISSKAANTIYINNVQLPHYEPAKLDTESKYWGELRHDDIVTVWWNVWVQKEFTRFKFECLWGKSRQPRWDDEFKVISEGPMLNQLESACLREELRLRKERDRRKHTEERSKVIEGSDERKEPAETKGTVRLKIPTNYSASAPVRGATNQSITSSHQSLSFKSGGV